MLQKCSLQLVLVKATACNTTCSWHVLKVDMLFQFTIFSGTESAMLPAGSRPFNYVLQRGLVLPPDLADREQELWSREPSPKEVHQFSLPPARLVGPVPLICFIALKQSCCWQPGLSLIGQLGQDPSPFVHTLSTTPS